MRSSGLIVRSAWLAALLGGCAGGNEQSDIDASTEQDASTDAGTDTDTGSCDHGAFLGDYTISSPYALEALVGYTGVTGDLHVTLSTGLMNLQGLECLEIVGGALRLDYNEALASLDGLENVAEIGSYLQIAWNPALVTADLSALKSTGTDIDIIYNESLESLDLDALEYVGGYLQISDNSSLVCDVDALLDGVEVGGAIGVSDNAPGDGCGPSSAGDGGV